MAGIRVLRVRITGLTASFRIPHVMIGRLPTFKMPPPATIYGFLAGALGIWFELNGLQFAYTFTYNGIAEDLELAHIVERAGGSFWKGGPPKNLQGNTNPQRREFLLHPSMTLYLAGNDDLVNQLAVAIRRPQFAALLGRSQDLATCREVAFTELEPAREGFISHTILPWSLRQWVLPGTPVFMPKTISDSYREPVFERYIEIGHRPVNVYNGSPDVTNVDSFGLFYIDRSEHYTNSMRTLYRAVIFHKLEREGVPV